MDQTGYARTGEPISDLHACVQSEGDCHHPSAQGQDPSAPEKLSVSPFFLLTRSLIPGHCPFSHTSLIQIKRTSHGTCTGSTERVAGQSGDFLKSVLYQPGEGGWPAQRVFLSLHVTTLACGGAGCGSKPGMTRSSFHIPVVRPGCSKWVRPRDFHRSSCDGHQAPAGPEELRQQKRCGVVLDCRALRCLCHRRCTAC